MPFELIKSETLLQGRVFKFRRDHLKTPDGGETKLDIIEHGGSVVLVPIDADGNMLFVRQYRHAAGMDLLELPAGTRDGDEPYEDCAAREIREETGMEAGKLEKVGEFYLAPGYSTEFMGVFLATELRHNPLDPDADEFLSVEKMSVRDALAMAERGEMPDAKSLAALLLARPYLEKYLVKPMMILIAGPYRSGTGDDPQKMEANVRAMEAYALPIFRKGHIPVLGEWFALPLVHLAGSKQVGDEAFDEIFHPIAERILDKCDAVLRVGGESKGADLMVEVAQKNGLQVYTSLEEIPTAK